MQVYMRDTKKVTNRIGLAMLALVLVTSFGAIPVTALVQLALPWLTNTVTGLWLINDLVIYALGMPAFLLVLCTIPNGQEPMRKKLAVGPGRFVQFLLFTYGSAYIVALATSLLLYVIMAGGTSSTLDAYNETFDSLSANPLVGLIFGACVPALGEEFMFRYMLRKKLRGAGDKIYIFLSALCFSLFHMTFMQLPFAFVLGAFFAWVYVMTDNIWFTVALHFLFNFNSAVLSDLIIDSDVATVLFGVFMLAAMVCAVVFMAMYFKKAAKLCRPPSEAGWAYKPYKPTGRERMLWAPLMPHAPVYAPPGYGAPPVYGAAGTYGMQGAYTAPATPGPQVEGAPQAYGTPNTQPGFHGSPPGPYSPQPPAGPAAGQPFNPEMQSPHGQQTYGQPYNPPQSQMPGMPQYPTGGTAYPPTKNPASPPHYAPPPDTAAQPPQYGGQPAAYGAPPPAYGAPPLYNQPQPYGMAAPPAHLAPCDGPPGHGDETWWQPPWGTPFKGAKGLCLANPGMILFMVITGLVVVVSLLI